MSRHRGRGAGFGTPPPEVRRRRAERAYLRLLGGDERGHEHPLVLLAVHRRAWEQAILDETLTLSAAP